MLCRARFWVRIFQMPERPLLDECPSYAEPVIVASVIVVLDERGTARLRDPSWGYKRKYEQEVHESEGCVWRKTLPTQTLRQVKHTSESNRIPAQGGCRALHVLALTALGKLRHRRGAAAAEHPLQHLHDEVIVNGTVVQSHQRLWAQNKKFAPTKRLELESAPDGSAG